MSVEPGYATLREYRKRLRAMLDDPELKGDLFSIGVSMLDFCVLRTADSRSWQSYADEVWEGTYGHRVRDVLRKDIRRYDALKDADNAAPMRSCGAPMVRRAGPCGQHATRQALLTDADTGRRQWLASCSRHGEWFTARVVANRQVVEEVEEPRRPYANAGGVLARHLPEIDWIKTWKGLDPTWEEPPEGQYEEVPLKPKLRLIMGDIA